MGSGSCIDSGGENEIIRKHGGLVFQGWTLGCLIVMGRLGRDRFAELWLGGKLLLCLGMRGLGSAVTQGLCQSLSRPLETSRLAAFDAARGVKPESVG